MRQIGKLLAMTLMMLASCTSKKKIVTTEVDSFDGCTINQDSLSKYFPLLAPNEHDWLKIKGEVRAEFKNDAYAVDVQLRIKPNDTVWISLSKASIPFLKILLLRDSIFAVDLFNKKFIKSDYIGLSERIGLEVNFNLLQNILLAQYLPLPDMNEQWTEQGKIAQSNLTKSALQKRYHAVDSSKHFIWAQWIECSSMSMNKQYLFLPQSKEELWIQSTDPDTSTYLSIPRHININALADTIKKIDLAIEYKRFKQASKMNVPFKIPENYAEME